MEFLDVFEHHVYDFILVFARTSAIVAFAPLFGANSVPNNVKALVAFVLSVVFTIILTPLDAVSEPSTAGLIMQLAGEATIGAAIGFSATLFFEMVIFAGYIIDYMIGFGFINIVDPQSGGSISIFAFFYSFMTLILFLISNSHHILIEMMVRSYDLIPVFGATVNEFSLNYLSRLAGAIFYSGFQLAAPLFIIMFIIDFTLGLISKTVPQLQILVVGFPVKISIGLTAIALVLQPTASFIGQTLGKYLDSLLWLFKYWGDGS